MNAKTIILIFIFAVSTLSIAASKDTKKAEFFKSAHKVLGEYKLVKSQKNHAQCAEEGNFTFVDSDSNQGIRLGHHIFLGPFSAETENTDNNKKYCKTTTEFVFTKNSVTEHTVNSNCPENAKSDEGSSTKTLQFSKNLIQYSIKESGFKCSYQLVGKSQP